MASEVDVNTLLFRFIINTKNLLHGCILNLQVKSYDPSSS